MSVVAMSSSVCNGCVCHCHSSHGNVETVIAASCKGLLSKLWRSRIISDIMMSKSIGDMFSSLQSAVNESSIVFWVISV